MTSLPKLGLSAGLIPLHRPDLAKVLILGPSLGGFSVEILGWRPVFLITGVLGSIVALLSINWLPITQTQQIKFDYLGSFLLAMFILAMVLIFRPIRESGWTSIENIILWTLLFVSLNLFIYQERSNPTPLVEFAIFKRNVFWRGLVCGMTYIATIKGLTYLLQYYLQSLLDYSPSESGIMWMIMSIATLFSNLVWGRFSDRYGDRRLIIYGGVLRFIALVLLGSISILGFTQNLFWILGIILVIFGLGTGLTITPLTSLIVGSFPQSQTGMVNGVYGMARNIAGILGILLFAQMLTISSPNVLDTSLELSPISVSFFLAALIGIGGIGVIIGLPENSISDTSPITKLKAGQGVSTSE
jgi:predicted MFS family arabinose efflux permease